VSGGNKKKIGGKLVSGVWKGGDGGAGGYMLKKMEGKIEWGKTGGKRIIQSVRRMLGTQAWGNLRSRRGKKGGQPLGPCPAGERPDTQKVRVELADGQKDTMT